MADKINKIMKIEGMSCGHCQARVENTLNALPGVSAKVDLKRGIAKIEVSGNETSNEDLLSAVSEAGYNPVSLENKRGIFG